jgi:membrane-associated phospholipid phosphatase
VTRRRERLVPYSITLGAAAATWLVIWFAEGDHFVRSVAGLLITQTAIVVLITLRWKISYHCCTAALTGVVFWIYAGTPLPLLLGLCLMVWSRLFLRRHTPGEVAAGSLLGLGLGTVHMLSIVGG